MKKKKIVTTYTDQSSNQYKNKGNFGRFFPIKSTQDSRVGYQKNNQNGQIKTFGDDQNNKLDSGVSINLKNDYEKRVLAQTIKSEDLIYDFDSSKDNSHYFDGAKKFIDLKLSFFSAAYINPLNTFQDVDVSTPGQAFSVAISPIDGTIYVAGNNETGDDYVLKRSVNGGAFSIIERDPTSTTDFIGFYPFPAA